MESEPLVVGSGPAKVLALHGWFGSATGWGPFAELVDGDRYSVAFVDYRGYGARRGEPGEFTLDEIARATPWRPSTRSAGRPSPSSGTRWAAVP